MNSFVVLLRGVNVGGNNKIPMTELKDCFEGLGYKNVSTYIASGNVILKSDKKSGEITEEIEKILPSEFKLDSPLIKVLALSADQLKSVVENAPKGFGGEPGKYHSDAIFLMNISPSEAFKVFKPREGVDEIWQGKLLIYSQRLSAQRTKSRLSQIMASPLYKSMTIRSWSTTTKLLDKLANMKDD